MGGGVTLSLCPLWLGLWACRSFGRESHAGPPRCRCAGWTWRLGGQSELSGRSETGQAGALLGDEALETPDPEETKESWPLLGLALVPSVPGGRGTVGRCLTRPGRYTVPVMPGLGCGQRVCEPNLTPGCLCKQGSPHTRGPAAWPSLGSAFGMVEIIPSPLPILAGRTCPSLVAAELCWQTMVAAGGGLRTPLYCTAQCHCLR